MHTLPYLLSFYLFLGTNVGALTAVIFYKIPKVKAPHLYTFCGFVLTALLAFELVPHALEEYGFISVAFGTSLGVLICTCLHGLLKDESSHSYRPALFIVSAIAIHNIPAGLAIGSTLDSEILSASFIAAIVIHQMPEGLAIMTALLLSARKRLSFVLFFLFSALLSGIFLFFTNIGHSLKLPLQSNGLLLGIAIGFLLFTAVWEFLFKKHS